MLTIEIPPPSHLEIGYAELQTLGLKTAFHTQAPWIVYAMGPTGDAQSGNRPVKVCFQRTPKTLPDCTDIVSGGEGGAMTYPHQSFGDGSAAHEGLAIEDLAPDIKGVVARATYYGGGSGARVRTIVWTFQSGKSEAFSQTFASNHSELGEDRRFAAGPMAGWYVAADFVWGEGETHFDPHRFTIDAYRLSKGGGYLRVLSYVTTAKYPAERQTPAAVIDHELPRLNALLKAAYPKGAPR